MFFLQHFVFAQDGLVKGMVIEQTDKGKILPVPGASVFWLGTTIGTNTDTNGVFQIRQEPRFYKLVISFVGYQSDTVIVLDEGEIKIILRTGNTLKEVTVTSGRSATYIDFLNPMATKSMSEKELFKAACCNLSESFETNPSVDVAFSDAVTGTKQIQMLGLAGIYTQITTENIPGLRGLASNYGLSFMPGPWLEGIQVTKGIGTVVNGYESIAGQINIELKKPNTAEKVFANLYINGMGRTEGNLNLAKKINTKLSTSLLLHTDYLNNQVDMNDDGFADLPVGRQLNAINRWHYENGKGLMLQINLKALADDRNGGQINGKYETLLDTAAIKNFSGPYKTNINTRRFEVSGKAGYVFPQQKYKSIGLQFSGITHYLNSYFGNTIYNAIGKSAYFNLIYQTIIANTNHQVRGGLSFNYDDYNENYKNSMYLRSEIVPGAFIEYTYNYKEKLSIVAGLRGDYHNLFGFFVTPRIHARYQLFENTTLRAGFGRGQRTANIFAENTTVLISARKVNILGESSKSLAYGLGPEVAWNAGLNLMHDFTLFRHSASFNIDFYKTIFNNQVVADLDFNPQQINFYNLSGKSFSNSFQAEINFKPFRKLEARLAYRMLDVQTNFHGQMLQRPLISKQRAFANLAYEHKKWKFDFTLNWNGKKRLPQTLTNPAEYQKNSFSPDFFYCQHANNLLGIERNGSLFWYRKHWQFQANGFNQFISKPLRALL